MKSRVLIFVSLLVGLSLIVVPAEAVDTISPLPSRFSDADIDEVPDFQKHVVPLLSRLGCNGRACHGSFQGRGDFRLSLFGYDFAADFKELNDPDSPRVDAADSEASLILTMPTDADIHGGGKRFDPAGWEYRVLHNWIQGGATFDGNNVAKLTRLEISPSEIQFSTNGEAEQLTVIAVWQDGSREDVTPLVRFTTNDDVIAAVDENGLITAGSGTGDTHVVIAYDKAVVPIPVLRPVSKLAGRRYPKVKTPTRVDELVVEKLRKLGIVPAALSTDAEFFRRLSLDLTGTLPTGSAVEEFLADTSADKRSNKIDELLETPAYAAWWATKLCDFTGNNDQQLTNTSPVRNAPGEIWYRWIEQRLAKNMPYDELAAGIILATSQKPNQSYIDYCKDMTELHGDDRDQKISEMETMPYYWARRDFRNPPERAINFAYAFMGIRIQCAQCHKHPFDVWSKQDFAEFSSFFSGVTFGASPAGKDRAVYQNMLKELGVSELRGGQLQRELAKKIQAGETVPFPTLYTRGPRKVNENGRPQGDELQEASILGGDVVQFERGQDVREPLMQWLRSKENPYFAKAFVNRVWANYFSIGIVDPPDDLSLANPPSNAALLDYLTQGFLDHDFDIKWLQREIINSRTYQLSWQTNETNQGDDRNFSHQIPRRLPAEVTVDAIALATASDQEAQRLHTEMQGRSISIASSSERFLQGNNLGTFGLMVFGRSTRESSCECDRSDDPTLLQTVYLQNDQDVYRLLDRRNTGWLHQVSQENKWAFTGVGRGSNSSNSTLNKRPVNYEQLIKNLDKRIAVLRKQGNAAEAKKLLNRRKVYLQRFGPPNSAEKEDVVSEDSVADNSNDDKVAQQVPGADEIVKQAYLRTLSRYPTEQELVQCVKYINESKDTINGVRGVLWALINTKEFVVNH